MFRKGSRVKFKMEGEIKHGTVQKCSRDKLEVSIDGEYDGVVRALAKAFAPSDKPAHKDPPTVMDRYEIKAWEEIDGHGDSRTFDAKIYKSGKPILRVSNNGWGGEDCYTPMKRKPGRGCKVLEQYDKDLLEWAKTFGYEIPKEDLWFLRSVWVEWKHFSQPLNKPAAVELEEMFGEEREALKEEIRNG